jgi:hypothetical protein
MASESGYLPLQQPGAGYNTPGAAAGTANYSAQQAPALQYAQQSSPASGGGGSGAAQATKTYTLPDAETQIWSRSKNRWPRVSNLPLYEIDKKNNTVPPRYDQILQQNIGNCYVAATLAAMANTDAGRRQITGMITPHKGAITTTCKKFKNDNTVGPQEQLKSNRWFSVSFKNTSIDVSDVLYHDDSDRDPNLIYMTTPGEKDRALWGAIIEVAYAKLKGGYDKIGGSQNTVNQFLAEFSAVKWTILDPANDRAAIKKACRSAGKRPAFIASKTEGTKTLSPFHGYAVLGMSGTKVSLWDPMQGKVKKIEFKDLLTEVQAVIGSS